MHKLGTKDAIKLMVNGSLALAEIEANGIRIHTEYLESAIVDTKSKIKTLTEEIRTDEVYETWRREYGQKTNLASRTQLAHVLFDVLGHESKSVTESSGRQKADAAALEYVDIPFVKKYITIEKLKKLLSVNLTGLKNEVVDGFIHPVFNLNLVVTFRSSCERPNTQNFPKRDEGIAEIVRRCLIAREGYQSVSLDFKAVEVMVGYCYHKDPTMYTYLTDPTTDMHRDMAAQCYMIGQEQVTSKARYCAKNLFVFPQFYGDYYIACARNLWEAIGKHKLETADGVPLKKHLKSKGIKRLGECNPQQRPEPNTFEKYLQEVEHDFWKNRFKVYDQWKKEWWEQYQEKGGFRTLTGFYVRWGKAGPLSKNECINNPVQGDAFHCNLWTIIQLRKKLKKYRMKTKLIGQIHDSTEADVWPSEMDDFLGMAKETVEVDLPKAWPWICVGLKIEAEVAPVGGSWWDKKTVKV